MFARFLNLKTFIMQVNIMHKINIPQESESERQLRTMTKTMTEPWPFSCPYRHITTESDKMASLLVRIYSFSLLLLLLLFLLMLLLLFFQSLAHFMPTNTKPSGTIGDTQIPMTISATSFRGCNRFSPLLICSLHEVNPRPSFPCATVPFLLWYFSYRNTSHPVLWYISFLQPDSTEVLHLVPLALDPPVLQVALELDIAIRSSSRREKASIHLCWIFKKRNWWMETFKPHYIYIY